MVTREDVTVDYTDSPRIVEVASPSVEFVAQDIVDTLRKKEDSFTGMTELKLINASGKDDLGGGVLVGITVAQQNTQVAFESRLTPAQTGTVTTGDADGITLTDTSAAFVSNNIRRGAVVINFVDESITEVVAIIDEFNLTCRVLRAGSTNTFSFGDSYKIWNIIQCDVTGGNVVSVDENDVTISPIFPTAFTQVIRTASSSATLQELSAIQFASFNSGITLDVINGLPGTTYPQGTLQAPVDNLIDAKLIATERGFDKIFIIGNYTFLTSDVINGFTFVGQNPLKTLIILTAAATIINCVFENCTITGTLDGGTSLNDCHINTLTNIDGDMHNCELEAGTITLSGTDAEFIDCYSGVAGVVTPIIDFNGDGPHCIFRNYSGGLTLKNLTTEQNVSVDLISGTVFLDATITAGTFVIRGVGDLIDNSTATLIVSDGLLKAKNITELHQLQGLDPDNPMTVTPTGRTVGDITQVISGDGDTSSTVTRS